MTGRPNRTRNAMNQAAVLESIPKHLDALKSTVGWATGMAFIVGWAGLTGEDPVRAFGTEVCREDAFVVAALFFVFMNVKIFDLLFRLSELPFLLDNATLRQGLSAIALHPFVANPFSYFGSGNCIAKITGAKGVSLLILLWWGANVSLLTLVPPFLGWVFFFILLAAGIASLLVVYWFYKNVERRLRKQGLYSDWWSDLRGLRYLLAIVAGVMGIVLALCVLCASSPACPSEATAPNSRPAAQGPDSCHSYDTETVPCVFSKRLFRESCA